MIAVIDLCENRTTTTSTTTINNNKSRSLYITTLELQKEGEVLKHTLELYFDLRIIRLYGEENEYLRRLAWIITVSTLLRDVLYTDQDCPLNNNTTLSPPITTTTTYKYIPTVETTTTYKYIPTVEELIRIVHGGEILFNKNLDTTTTTNATNTTNTTSTTNKIHLDSQSEGMTPANTYMIDYTGRQLYEYLRFSRLEKVLQTQQDASAFLSTTHSTDNNDWRERSDSIYLGFQALVSNYIVRFSERDDLYVKIANISIYKDISKCICSKIDKVIPITYDNYSNNTDSNNNSSNLGNDNNDNNSNLIYDHIDNNNLNNNNRIKYYCWCRGIDDGSAMIQCDCCDEWYHCICVFTNTTNNSSNNISSNSSKGGIIIHNILDKKKKRFKKNVLDSIHATTYICIYCTFIQKQLNCSKLEN